MKNLNDVSETTPPTLDAVSIKFLGLIMREWLFGVRALLHSLDLCIEHIPRAKVIHLANASLNLTTVVRPVRFPVQAGRAPGGATICLADKCIPAVEILQARC